MLNLSPTIEHEYHRVVSTLDGEDPYTGQGYLGIIDVLNAHFLIADFFYQENYGLGGIGPRSMNLLHSALHRQHISYGGKRKWTDKFEICATLFYGLIKDHPFYDANKRTALLSMLYHLDTLGYCPTLSQKNLEDFTVLVAEDNLGQFKRYKEMSDRSVDKADNAVRFIARHLRKHCRNIDTKTYSITYRQLQTILNKFGYDLRNPRNNTIDVVRERERRTIFGMFGKREKVGVKVVQIGFPNWTAEVGKGAIKTVRKETKLTYKYGVDSQTFFNDADPIQVLISKYREPLRKLSNR